MNKDLGTLISVLKDIAIYKYDGHYTIFSFTTGYRVMLGTPDLDSGAGRRELEEATNTCSTLEDAITNCIINELE
jgi:hypothetical protein